MVKWLQSTTAIWEDVGFEDVPENDMDDMDDDGDVCSIDMGELLPLCLEAVPPFPKQGPDNTLFGLHQRIHHLGLSTGPIGDATYPPYVEDRYSVPRQLALDPSAYTFSSDNISSMTEDETCTKHVGKSIASKLRKAASQGVAACRMLREKWGR
ncbi:hypothetical protein N7492_007026 [Penicillium capsulatum]|uniref:Uncharacterized protein n=1 Tax=Penicillium capsulatum TaxID=69766 RepID=A0A9W9I0H4_9EURO|nr:hypothetical protein N7492_007026 [Penicillium capsulatum]KAJ6116860.1 hypothetical protein N7512_006585 [Penicillium capsulatum]